MKFFSKRNKKIYREISPIRHGIGRYNRNTRDHLVIMNDELRNRISSEINFITSRNDFIEFFLLFEDQNAGKIFLDSNKVDDFSLAELGYKMSDYFEFENFYIQEKFSDEFLTRRDSETGKIENVKNNVKYFDDPKIFDLVEFIILFSKKEKRIDVTKRFNDILSEENSSFKIINGTIVKEEGESLSTIKNLLKDENLKKKLEDFEYYDDNEDYFNTSKISMEILNIIFSDYIDKNKKKEIGKNIKKIVNNLIVKQGNLKEKTEDLYNYLNDTLFLLKDLNNNIYNIRHTEKSTIQTKNNYIYKLISNYNISLVELSLSNLKDSFIFTENWEKIKKEYLDKYQINKGIRFINKKSTANLDNPLDDIDPADIPF